MSGSMRETIKALTSVFSAPTAPYPLPDELRAAIESFLERYDNVDDHNSQRLHEDLHALYLRHVAGSSEKRGPFLSALRLLRPAIIGETRLTAWWDLVLKPTIDGIGHKRHEIEDAREFVQSILAYDVETDQDGEGARLSELFTKRILSAYLLRTNVPSTPEDVVSPENEFVSHELESVLVTFGRKMPKALLLALDGLFVQKQYRLQALNLLSAFVRLQPPHLHQVLETSLIQHLEKCLLIDTSSTVIELALVVLIMFLPHICGALTSDHHLAKAFLIFTRVLCWDKLGTAEETKPTDENAQRRDEESEAEDGDDAESEQAWEQVQQSMSYPDSSLPTLMHYFTFLYGLFPLNFMSFIRKPRKYLKSLNFPGARDFDLDQDLIYSRTEPYRRVHLLHPNMFTTTVEDELSENRWLRSDPADVVTECMDLCVAVSSTLHDPGPPPSTALPPVPEVPTQFSLEEHGTTANDSNESWRNTQSTVFVPPNEVPDMPETFEIPPSTKSVKSFKSIKSAASPLLKGRDVMDSPTLPPAKDSKKQDLLGAAIETQQPSLDSFVQSVAGSTSPPHAEFHNQTLASLQREIMLLRNDLNFERYLKLQHLSHIGQLQRKHIKEATAEAETQNLINTNKTLKARLSKANDLYAQLKKETLTSRSQSKKWETDLSAKVRTYKESEKSWLNDEGGLRFELQRTQSDYEHLKKIVEKAEGEQLKAQQRTRALEFELEDYGNVRRELQAAQEKIMSYDDQRKELHTLMQDRNELRNDLEMANMRLNSRELERERSIKAYERRIMELETRLQMSERNTGKPGQLPSSVQQMLDSALAASHAKLQQLKKTHYRLLEQYTELQMKYLDLEGQQQAEVGQLYAQEKSGHLDFGRTRVSRSSSMRQANNYNSRFLPPLATEITPSEEQEYYSDYRSPESVNSPATTASPVRPARVGSLQSQRPQKSQTTPSPYPGFGGGLGPDFSAAYDASLNNQFQAQNTGSAPQSSGKSTYSVDTEGSNGKEKKDKVDPKSEVRVFGRGGAQNIGKKVKEKDQKKPASSKTGGFRGLKGIM